MRMITISDAFLYRMGIVMMLARPEFPRQAADQGPIWLHPDDVSPTSEVGTGVGFCFRHRRKQGR